MFRYDNSVLGCMPVEGKPIVVSVARWQRSTPLTFSEYSHYLEFLGEKQAQHNTSCAWRINACRVVFMLTVVPNTVCLCLVHVQIVSKMKSYKCDIASVIPIISYRLWAVKKGYKMMVESAHSRVHVQLATRCPDNVTNMCNE